MTSKPFNWDFRKFFTGQTISNFGTSITAFALPLLVFKLTGSAINLALASAATFLPYLLFGLVIGAWTDRTDPKRLMIACDRGRALVLASNPVASLPRPRRAGRRPRPPSPPSRHASRPARDCRGGWPACPRRLRRPRPAWSRDRAQGMTR